MSDWQFVRRVLIVLAVGGLGAVVWVLSDLLLLVFAASLGAIAFRTMMAPVMRATGLSEPFALALVVLLITAFVAALVLQFGSHLSDQVGYLVQNAPQALRSLSERLDLPAVSEQVGGSAIGAIAAGAVSVGSSVVGAVAGLVLVFVGGLYLAASPHLYRRGLMALVPKHWHAVVSSTLDDSGFALGRWLRAQGIAMIVIGLLTGFGMWAVGVPSPMALGLIAGALEFIPIIGPIVGAIPALLLASTQGWELTLWALGVAVLVQMVENNLVMPFVVGRVVELPAAVGLFATIAMGILFGPLGLLLGYPLAIVADVAIRRLYVREALGKPVEIPAERGRKAEERQADPEL